MQKRLPIIANLQSSHRKTTTLATLHRGLSWQRVVVSATTPTPHQTFLTLAFSVHDFVCVPEVISALDYVCGLQLPAGASGCMNML